ncbi:M-phase phosphoprotein 6 [Ostreococcus tauri]|uniref:M-phase phosphoprotein 6 n=2 Tax=Ostreococcus tauri TaxID=70448 RepID=Q00T29_OSTTA|nr:M-phase phosphoprotein 6 [Ostreococcus tauri]CAL57987.1 M-phase phosphoprotein 6 [Ostreococcus tauri]|eukprot:XP_003084020.1 M-phase phosphoprotein 6 [Ostreococcus tauri]
MSATPTPTDASTASTPAGAGYSSKILGLKFMQRARERERAVETIAGANKKIADDRPEPAVFAKNRAKINLPMIRREERTEVPIPCDGVGRFSFGGANPEVEALHKELRERKRAKKAMKRAKRSKDADVGEEEMADASFAAKRKQKAPEPGFEKPPELGSGKKRKK